MVPYVAINFFLTTITHFFFGDAAGRRHPVRRLESPASLLNRLGVEANGRLECLRNRGRVHVARLDQRRVARLRYRESAP